MRTDAKYRLTLVGGPNCGSEFVTNDDEFAWPPPMFLYVDGFRGVYRRGRLSSQDLGDVGFLHARYVWEQG